jgi:hypothetical protein
MDVLNLLVGKKILVKASDGTNLEGVLEIASVKPDHHSRELTPSTRENDFYPEMQYWTTYIVTFTNGGRKVYDSIESIKIQ